MKAIAAFIGELPKLEFGDSATRASRLQTWLGAVSQAVQPAGPHLIKWWQWVQQEAERAHKLFLVTPVMSRESILPTASIPDPWLQLESWMRPKLLEVLTKDIRDWVNMRARQNVIDPSHVLVFYLMKSFSPGGAEEREQLTN